MARNYWLLVIFSVALALCASRPAYPSSFEHFAVGYIGGSIVSKGVEKVSPDDKWARLFVPVVVMGFAGWVHEWTQFHDNGGRSSDVGEDIAAVAFGAAAGAAMEIEFDCLICL